MQEEEVGIITHYFGHLSVAAIKITKKELKVGDLIHIKGHTTDFEQPIDSIQIEHEMVDKAVNGQSIGIKVKDKVREHDLVYKVTK